MCVDSGPTGRVHAANRNEVSASKNTGRRGIVHRWLAGDLGRRMDPGPLFVPGDGRPEEAVRKLPADEVPIYAALDAIHRSFEQVLQELERVQTLPWFHQRAPLKPVQLAIEEARAWTMFEILEVLHEREEEEWIRLGRRRARRERKSAKPRRKSR
jgi:hypothetical protein